MNDVVAVFRQRLEENEWLGDETKARRRSKSSIRSRCAWLYPVTTGRCTIIRIALPEDGLDHRLQATAVRGKKYVGEGGQRQRRRSIKDLSG